MKKLGILFALLISSCVAVDPNSVIQQSGNKPSNEQTIELVKGYLNENLLDRESLRSLRIKESFAGSYVFDKGWVVCFEYNAKNILGGFAGNSQSQLLIKNGQASGIMADFSKPSNPWLFANDCQKQKWIYEQK